MTLYDCGPAAITVTLGDLEDPTLVLPPEPDGEGVAVWWNQMDDPDWSLRYTYAPPSAYVPGQVLLAAVEDLANLPLRVAVRGTTLAEVVAQKNAVKAALGAWPGTVTLTAVMPEDPTPVVIGGPWQTFPVVPTWGPVVPDLWGLLVAETAFSLPVNPAGAP